MTVGIAVAEALNDYTLKLTFDGDVAFDANAFNPANYAVAVRLGDGRQVQVRSVQAAGISGTVVYLFLHSYFSLNGRYAVRVSGLLDTNGDAVNTADFNFNSNG